MFNDLNVVIRATCVFLELCCIRRDTRLVLIDGVKTLSNLNVGLLPFAPCFSSLSIFPWLCERKGRKGVWDAIESWSQTSLLQVAMNG